MKLTFDRATREYSPAVGLDLVPGEFEYPDEKADALIAIGLRKVESPVPAKKGKE